MKQSVTFRLPLTDLESRLAMALADRDEEARLRITIEGIAASYSLVEGRIACVTVVFDDDAVAKVEQA